MAYACRVESIYITAAAKLFYFWSKIQQDILQFIPYRLTCTTVIFFLYMPDSIWLFRKS